MSELYLVRHGQASFASSDYDRLSPIGHEQAALLAAHWREQGLRFDAVYAGSLRRQRETAAALCALADDPVPRVDAGFDEYDSRAILQCYRRQFAAAGASGDMKDLKVFQRTLESACARWLGNELQGGGNGPEIESFTAFRARVHDSLEAVMRENPDGRRIVIATSGGVIATAVQSVLRMPDAETINLHWLLHNASVTRIRYSGTRRSLETFNAIPHLERPGRADRLTYR
jgi:broad specificity phosphatase PhoE